MWQEILKRDMETQEADEEYKKDTRASSLDSEAGVCYSYVPVTDPLAFPLHPPYTAPVC